MRAALVAALAGLVLLAGAATGRASTPPCIGNASASPTMPWTPTAPVVLPAAPGATTGVEGQPVTVSFGSFCDWSSTPQAQISVSVYWGSGMLSTGVATPTGTIEVAGTQPCARPLADPAAACPLVARTQTATTYAVTATYTFPGSGTFAPKATVIGAGTTVLKAGTVTIADVPLDALASDPIRPSAGRPFRGVVARFKDEDPLAVNPHMYKATVDWGNGLTSVGKISTGPSGTYLVKAPHTFRAGGPDAYTVTISDIGGSTTTVGGEALGPAPPSGAPGVAVRHGSTYTRSRNVALSLVWPDGARTATISEDPAFAGAKTVAIHRSVPWTLRSAGGSQTVYVRFGSSQEIHSDEIVLDRSRPVVTAASARRNPNGSGYTLAIAATDRFSGVAGIQVGYRDRPAPEARLTARPSQHVARRPRWVRAVDRAGNPSKWRPVTTLRT